jgi:hypothetical protein
MSASLSPAARRGRRCIPEGEFFNVLRGDEVVAECVNSRAAAQAALRTWRNIMGNDPPLRIVRLRVEYREAE